MIRVEPRPEPEDFDANVRLPGHDALRELRGEPRLRTRPGPRRTQRDVIRAGDLPAYWTECLEDLHEAYGGICAYSCFHIESATRDWTVDHYLPKGSEPLENAYEWSNYRLASRVMNSHKHQFTDVLDPFTVKDGWFEINFFSFEVHAAEGVPDAVRIQVNASINRLTLNERSMRQLRKRYFDAYQSGDISLRYLEQYAPFVAREMVRQGKATRRGSN